MEFNQGHHPLVCSNPCFICKNFSVLLLLSSKRSNKFLFLRLSGDSLTASCAMCFFAGSVATRPRNRGERGREPSREARLSLRFAAFFCFGLRDVDGRIWKPTSPRQLCMCSMLCAVMSLSFVASHMLACPDFLVEFCSVIAPSVCPLFGGTKSVFHLCVGLEIRAI